MKIKSFMAALFILLTVSLILTSLSNKRVYGQSPDSNAMFTPPANAQIDFVNHTIQVLYQGSIIINDTVQISAVSGESTAFSHFLVGFPHGFKSNLFYCAAFNSSTQEELSVELDTGLGREGYYGVNVLFPKTIELANGKTCRFTVVFVLSNVITMSSVQVLGEDPTAGEERQNVTVDQASMSLPLYPSLIINASTCDVSVILQPDTTCNNPDELPDFTKTTVGSYEVWKHVKTPLEKFAYTNTQFKIIPNPAQGPGLTKYDVNDMELKIELKEPRQLLITNTLRLTNTHIYEMQTFQFRTPSEARDLTMTDDVGNTLYPVSMNKTANLYSVLFRKILQPNQTVAVKITYYLPWDNHLAQSDWQKFNFSFTIDYIDCAVKKMTARILLPENAKLVEFDAPSIGVPFTLQKESFQEQATTTFYNVTPINIYQIRFEYQYSLFWASFRPTLWVSSLLGLVCAIVLVWRSRKPAIQVPITPISPRLLKSFVESYEKKSQLLSKLELIEERVNKGRMSRREYKITKRTTENNIAGIDRELASLKEKLRSAGSRYAEIVKQIEFAETELEEVKAGENRVKARYSRGELTLDAYRKLLDDYAKRRERAETSIEGALMPLREGIL